MCGPDATWSVQSQELELVSDHSGLCLPESGLPSLEADTDMWAQASEQNLTCFLLTSSTFAILAPNGNGAPLGALYCRR